MDETIITATSLTIIAGHLGFDPEKRRLRNIAFFHYIIHWSYSAIEPLILKLVDILLTNRTLMENKWGMRMLKHIARTCRPMPHGIVVTTQAAHRIVDYLDNLEGAQKGRFAIGPCLCQTSMSKYEGPLMKDIQFLYARDMFLSLKMGHQPSSAAKVKQLLTECRDHGYIHALEMCMQSGKWLFCICNCEPRICAPTRIYLQTGDFLWPGPEVCQVLPDKCIGMQNCGKCVQRCMFVANPAMNGKADVNAIKCMGCGLCILTCPAHARQMIQRDDYNQNHLVPAEMLTGGLVKYEN